MVKDYGNISADICLAMQAAGQAGHSISMQKLQSLWHWAMPKCMFMVSTVCLPTSNLDKISRVCQSGPIRWFNCAWVVNLNKPLWAWIKIPSNLHSITKKTLSGFQFGLCGVQPILQFESRRVALRRIGHLRDVSDLYLNTFPIGSCNEFFFLGSWSFH